MYEFMKDISLRDNGDPTAGTGSEDHVALSHGGDAEAQERRSGRCKGQG
jgi:hypothetical protein